MIEDEAGTALRNDLEILGGRRAVAKGDHHLRRLRWKPVVVERVSTGCLEAVQGIGARLIALFEVAHNLVGG